MKTQSISEEQVAELLEVIMAYARLDFSKRSKVSDADSLFDAVSSGVNMLGEELNSSVVSLKEKEQLLQEIHHRVKNNMQIISSMLRLQCSMTNDPAIRSMMNDCHSRITAMSLIHEMLYSTRGLTYNNLSEYIFKLTENIRISYEKDYHRVSFDLDVDDTIILDIDRLIPLGLILNEIICNSFKHAFPEGEGTIYVHVSKEDDGHNIKVGDNGQGLDHVPPAHPESLGMQLVYMLTEQLDSAIHQQNSNGLHYQLRIEE